MYVAGFEINLSAGHLHMVFGLKKISPYDGIYIVF